MKFHVNPPPNRSSADELYSWLYSLAQQLNVVLANLGYENMNREMRTVLEECTQEKERL